MKEIKITPYDSVEDMVTEVLSIATKQLEPGDIGFVGNVDIIQDILTVVLQSTDYVIDVIDMNTYDYDDIYQLTIDDEYFVSVLPVSTENGYISFCDDCLYVSDEVPVSYIRSLDDNEVKYTVFGFDYDIDEDECDDEVDVSTSVSKMTDDEAQDLIDHASFVIVWNNYDRLPEKFQQFVDFVRDWGF